jgi:hypothetical protein
MFVPKVICIEYNPTMPADLIYIPPKDDTIRHGCSLSALVELLCGGSSDDDGTGTNGKKKTKDKKKNKMNGHTYARSSSNNSNNRDNNSHDTDNTDTENTKDDCQDTACNSRQGDYVLIEVTLYNAFFVHRTLVYDRHRFAVYVPDPTIDTILTNHYRYYPPMGTTLYQLYDGTIRLWNCKKLLWHRISIDEEQINRTIRQQLLRQQVATTTTTTNNNNNNNNNNKQQQPLQEYGQQPYFPFEPNQKKNNNNKCTKTDRYIVNGVAEANNNNKNHTKNQYPKSSPNDTRNHNNFDYSQVVDVSSFCREHEKDTAVQKENEGEWLRQQKIKDKEQFECSQALLEQLQRNDGFCYITGTGINPKLCTKTLHYSKTFLHSEEMEDVRRSTLSSTDRARRGYSPTNTENFASLLQSTPPPTTPTADACTGKNNNNE